MSQHSQRHDSEADYFAVEASSGIKQDYLLIEHDYVSIEHWQRQLSGRWKEQTVATLEVGLLLPTLGVTLPLREVYLDAF